MWWTLKHDLRTLWRWIGRNTPGWCAIGRHFVRFGKLHRVYRTDGTSLNSCGPCDNDKLHWGNK